ncbi:hypothetical protein GCM10027168_41620 [Streptomyces capparidis]
MVLRPSRGVDRDDHRAGTALDLDALDVAPAVLTWRQDHALREGAAPAGAFTDEYALGPRRRPGTGRRRDPARLTPCAARPAASSATAAAG